MSVQDGPTGKNLEQALADLSASNVRLQAEVAERAGAEEALRISEERLRLALCAADVGTWDVDVDSGHLIGSPNIADVVGFDAGGSVKAWFRHLHPEDRERVHEQYSRASSGEDFFDLEYRLLHPHTGEVVWLRSKGHLVGARRHGRYMGVTQNVTARKRREANTTFLAVLDSEFALLADAQDIMRIATQRIASHLGATNVAFLEIDRSGDAATLLDSLTVSPAAPPDRRYRVEDFLSEAYVADLRAGRLVVVDDVRTDPRTAATAATFLAHGVAADIESPFLSDGRWRFHLSIVHSEPHAWQADEVDLVRDLTVRVWLRLERARAESQLRASEQGMQLVTSAGHVYPWRIDLASERVTVAENLPRLLDFEPPLTPEEFFLRVHPEDRERVIVEYQRASRESGSLEIEYRFMHPRTGKTLWLCSEGSVLRNRAGVATSLVGVTVDITRRKRAEKALRAANRRKDEFLATLAHELRNPLAPLRNSIEILRRCGDAGPTVAQVRTMMERQVDTMTRLVDDLLEVARISRGNIDLRQEAVDLPTVIHNAIETSRPLIERAGHELTVSLPFAPLPLRADPVRLAQVLSNLLSNAAKYTDPGGHIEIFARQDGDTVVLTVRDNGIGIPAEMLPHVFELFSQVDRSCGRTQGGLGIGLSLVERLVQLHGGTVTAHSGGPGKGSEFTVRLPLAEARSFPAPPPEAPAAGVAEPPPRQLYRTLIVDDNHDAADSLNTMLSLMGAESAVAYDGPSALELGERFRPEAILLDIGMPGMDGYEVARRIRQHPELRKARLIALTGWGQPEDRHRAKQAGIDHHLLKPVDTAALEDLLDRTRAHDRTHAA